MDFAINTIKALFLLAIIGIVVGTCQNTFGDYYYIKTSDNVIGKVYGCKPPLELDDLIGKKVFIQYKKNDVFIHIKAVNNKTEKIATVIGKTDGWTKKLYVHYGDGTILLEVPKIIKYGDTIRIIKTDTGIQYSYDPYKGEILVLKKP